MPSLVSPSSHTSSLLDSPPHSLQQSPEQHETHHVSPDRSPRGDPEETVEPGTVRSPRGPDTDVENTNWIDDDKGPPSSPELSDNTGQDEDVQSDATENLGLGKFFQPTEDEDEDDSDDIESNDDSQVSEDDRRRWHRTIPAALFHLGRPCTNLPTSSLMAFVERSLLDRFQQFRSSLSRLALSFQMILVISFL